MLVFQVVSFQKVVFVEIHVDKNAAIGGCTHHTHKNAEMGRPTSSDYKGGNQMGESETRHVTTLCDSSHKPKLASHILTMSACSGPLDIHLRYMLHTSHKPL